jgi:hypothetical protein
MKINEGLKRHDGTALLLQTIIIPSACSKLGYCISDMSNLISPACGSPRFCNECSRKCLVVADLAPFFTSTVTALLTQERVTRTKL